MEDKDTKALRQEGTKVIIDNVDVTECFWRATNKIGNDIGTYCRCYTGSCKKQSCYYKQMKELEGRNRQWEMCCKMWREKYEEVVKVLAEVNDMATNLVSHTQTCKEIIGE